MAGSASRASSSRPVAPAAMALVTVAGSKNRPAVLGDAPNPPWK
jgi:hypothetical protein